MREAQYPSELEVRPAVPEDAGGIARTYLESAGYHAALDPERYAVPPVQTILARYREGSQASGQAVTLVAELRGEIIGFVDARLEKSDDAMHREMTYCHIAEIAVRADHRSHGVGESLMHAAEEWGRLQGARFASLEYHAANTAAASFYRDKMGYRTAAVTAIKPL